MEKPKKLKISSLISDSVQSGVLDKYNRLLRASMVDFFIATYDDKELVKTEKMFDFDLETDYHFPFDQDKFLNFLTKDTGIISKNYEYSYVLNLIQTDPKKKEALYDIYQEENL